MSERALIIWGAGGHSLVVAELVRGDARFRIAGYLDDANPEQRSGHDPDAPVLGGRGELGGLRARGLTQLLLAIGDCQRRLEAAAFAAALGFEFPVLSHPSAVISRSAQIGAGTILVAGAILNAGVRIGEQCIVNTAASIDHECVLEDGVHVSPGARLAGRVRVGRGAWIGIGASIKENVEIGAGAVVGAGAAVVRDVAPNTVVVGVPARPLADRRGRT